MKGCSMMYMEGNTNTVYAHLLDWIDIASISSPEELDAAVDIVLDVNQSQGVMAPTDIHEYLSGLFGTSANVFSAYIGIDLSVEIALARFQLILMSYERCLFRATEFLEGSHSVEREFRQLLSVCGGFQTETLGVCGDTNRFFRPDFCASIEAQQICLALSEAASRGSQAGLTLIRSFADVSAAEQISFCVANSFLSLPGINFVAEFDLQSNEKRNNCYDFVWCVSMVEAKAETLGLAELDLRFPEYKFLDKRNGFSEGLSILDQIDGYADKGLANFCSYRLHQHLLAIIGYEGTKLLACTSGYASQNAMPLWRQIGTYSEAQVCAPFLAACSYFPQRSGAAHQVDEQMRPYMLSVLKNTETVPLQIRKAASVIAAMSFFAEQGIIIGTPPKGKEANRCWRQKAPKSDVLWVGNQCLDYHRQSRLGAILSVIADTSTLLAYLPPHEEWKSVEAPSVFNWLSEPLQDDIRYDLALSAVLACAELLDLQTIRDLMAVMSICVCGDYAFTIKDIEKRIQGSRAHKSSSYIHWANFTDELWGATAGLSEDLPERVDFFGFETGAPCGGRGQQKSVLDNEQRRDEVPPEIFDLLGRLEATTNHPIRLPSRYVSGHYMGEMAYWLFAKRRGQDLLRRLEHILSERPAIAKTLRNE